MKIKNMTLHLVYVVIILVLALIALSTYKVGDEDTTIKYISFASTISSLLLAVIAIFFAIYSNFSITGSIGEITKASSGLVDHSKSIEQYSAEIEKKLEAVVPGVLEGVKKEVDSGFEGLKEAMMERPHPEDESGIKSGEGKKEIIDDAFFNLISFAGAALLYALKKANSEGMPLDLRKLGEITDIGMDYFWGMLILLHSVDAARMTEKDNVYVITYVDDTIKKDIEKYLLEKQKNTEKLMTKRELDCSAPNYKNSIDEYFDE